MSDTTVVRIPREIYEEAEKLRKEFLKKPWDKTNPFTILAMGGKTAFMGGLIGYAIRKIEEQEH